MRVVGVDKVCQRMCQHQVVSMMKPASGYVPFHIRREDGGALPRKMQSSQAKMHIFMVAEKCNVWRLTFDVSFLVGGFMGVAFVSASRDGMGVKRVETRA